MPKKKNSFLDGLMKGIGRRLGERRKEVHDAIDRFHEELEDPGKEREADSTVAENVQDPLQDEGATGTDEAT